MYWKTVWFHPKRVAESIRERYLLRHLFYLIIIVDLLLPFATGLAWRAPVIYSVIVSLTSLTMLIMSPFFFALLQKLLIFICRGKIRYLEIVKVLFITLIFTIVQEILSMFFFLTESVGTSRILSDLILFLWIVVAIWGAWVVLVMLSQLSGVKFWTLAIVNIVMFVLLSLLLSIAGAIIYEFVKLLLWGLEFISNYGFTR